MPLAETVAPIRWSRDWPRPRPIAARKGPDSLVHGIQWLQGYRIIVDRGCADLIRELSAYCWKEGSPPQPRPGDDHLIDAMRYALESEQRPRKATLRKKSEVIGR